VDAALCPSGIKIHSAIHRDRLIKLADHDGMSKPALRNLWQGLIGTLNVSGLRRELIPILAFELQEKAYLPARLRSSDRFATETHTSRPGEHDRAIWECLHDGDAKTHGAAVQMVLPGRKEAGLEGVSA
jgi:hypothetical protein